MQFSSISGLSREQHDVEIREPSASSADPTQKGNYYFCHASCFFIRSKSKTVNRFIEAARGTIMYVF